MFDARLPAGPSVVFQVEMREGDQPPGEREDDPAERERHREYEQVPAPLNVDHRREDVREEAPAALVDVDSRDVTLAVFADQTTLASSRHQPPETLLAQHRRHLGACNNNNNAIYIAQIRAQQQMGCRVISVQNRSSLFISNLAVAQPNNVYI